MGQPPFAARVLAVVASLCVALSFSTACGSTTFDASGADPNDAGGAEGGGDGGSCSKDLTTDGQNCGSCGNACTADQACVASKCVAGCNGATIYVSNSGDDSKTGCTPATAKQTIGGAISAAKQGVFVGYEIHVCAGTYREAVVLDAPVTLRGSYDCSTWTQSAKYGFPDFDQTNRTAIVAPDSALAATSLTVDDDAIGVAQLVDGFAIGGPKVSKGASTGVRVRLGKPTLSNDVIGGGSGIGLATDPDNVAGSIGLRISADAPKIVKNLISGGAGSALAGSAGSIGIYVDPGVGMASIQGNAIDGGKGDASQTTGANTSIGLFLAGGTFTGTNAISGNSISGGVGSAIGMATNSVNVFGLLIAGATADIFANTIVGGTASCSACTHLFVSAAYVGDPAPAHVAFVDNRFYGGDVVDNPASTSTMVGLDIQTNTPVLISDNLVHAGNGGQVAPHAGLAVLGILLDHTDESVIEHNTIALGKSAGRALDLGASETHTAIIDNLFIGAVVGVSDVGIYMLSCGGSATPISTLTNNGFVGFGGPPLAIESGTAPCAAGSYALIADLDTQVAAQNGATVGANFAAKGNCGTDTPARCQVVGACDLSASSNDYQTCMDATFAAWDASSVGAGTLLDGWHLRTTVPCGILRPATTPVLAIGVDTDHYGTVFPAARASIGAEQQAAACP